MKVRISLLIVVLMITHLHVAFAVRSTGRDCYVTFFKSVSQNFAHWFEGTSDTEIIEKYEWKGTNTLYPWLESVGYQDATIFGRVNARQSTDGNGTVGVIPWGSVSGPNFSMDIEKDFNISGVGMVLGFDDMVLMSVKNSKSTTRPGTYTLTGAADFVAVGGGGGITVFGSGYTLSGTVEFETTKSAKPKTLTLPVKRKYPKSYECAHEDCEVALPNKHHHRVICQEDRWLSGPQRRTTCRREYYLCQTTTCPLDYMHAAFHACGVHEDSKSNVRMYASDHALQASCPVNITQDGGNAYCTVTNFYKCQSHTHVFPPPQSSTNSQSSGSLSPEPDGDDGSDDPSDTTTTCPCGVSYDPMVVSDHNTHRERTCRDCGQTWRKCISPIPPTCNKPWRQENNLPCRPLP